MDCAEARDVLLAHQRGSLAPGADAAVREHLAACAACARVDAAERTLSEVLEQRLPQHPAPPALKRRLAAEWPAVVDHPRRSWQWLMAPALALAAAVVVLATTPLLYQRFVVSGQRDALVTEAINDHLRVLLSQRPIEAESSDMHAIKPWFAGRLDFAPVVAFAGDGEFPLRGGAVGYFLDRRAAVFLYSRRLHAISLFVVRAEGLPLPAQRLETSSRGFSLIAWRAGELGYVLVSDVDAGELRTLAAKVRGEPA